MPDAILAKIKKIKILISSKMALTILIFEIYISQENFKIAKFDPSTYKSFIGKIFFFIKLSIQRLSVKLEFTQSQYKPNILFQFLFIFLKSKKSLWIFYLTLFEVYSLWCIILIFLGYFEILQNAPREIFLSFSIQPLILDSFALWDSKKRIRNVQEETNSYQRKTMW